MSNLTTNSGPVTSYMVVTNPAGTATFPSNGIGGTTTTHGSSDMQDQGHYRPYRVTVLTLPAADSAFQVTDRTGAVMWTQGVGLSQATNRQYEWNIAIRGGFGIIFNEAAMVLLVEYIKVS